MFARLHDNASFGGVVEQGEKGQGRHVVARIHTSLQTWILFGRNKLNQSPQNMDFRWVFFVVFFLKKTN